MAALREKIKTLQAHKKLKNIELAKLAGIPNSTLADILKGKTERVSIRNLKALADALDSPVSFLLDDRAPENDSPAGGPARGGLAQDEGDLLSLFRRLDRRARELLVAVARQQLAYQGEAAAPAPRVAEEDWRRFVGTVTAARGGVKLADEDAAREMAVIKRAFLED